jgi:hypothetical protein
MNNKYINGIVIALLVVNIILGGMAVGGKSSQSLNLGQSGTRFPNGISADSTSPIAGEVRGTTLVVTGTSTVGSVGSAISKMISGTFTSTSCIGPASIGIYASAQYGCSVAGVVSGDRVFISLASTTNTTVFQYFATASTTAGKLDIGLTNVSTTTVATATTTGATYWIVR